MAYQVLILPAAEADLASLDPTARNRALRRLVWLGENADAIIHHRLVNMPEDLAGLCRMRIGDYRVLYWLHPAQRILKVYRVQHRREVYREL